MRKKRRLWLGIMGIGILMLSGCIKAVKVSALYREQEIYFSLEKAFYSSNQYLELSTIVPASIYYTTDGSVPSRESTLYQEPIFLEAGEETEAAVIRAIACYGEEEESEVCTKTYFMGKNAKERFSTLVVSISCNPEDLYDYENGILVTGKLRDDYVLANPDLDITDRAPANYNLRGMESERKAHVEIWEPDGTRVVNQDLGIRVHGGVSRGSERKSLRLIARDEYGNSQISYALFPESRNAKDGMEKKEYDKVVLRNHGNDQERAYLRNELSQRLARDAGFLDTQELRGAAVFLNGTYYGFDWLEEYYDEEYLHQNYGTTKEQGTWYIFTPHRGGAATASQEEAELWAVYDLNQMYSYQTKDLRDDAVFAELTKLLDVDNFLQYCAIEIYLSNPDWPDNNNRVYRWYSDQKDYSNPYADGRWRYLLYDLDVAMGRTGSSIASNPTLGVVLGCEESDWDRQNPLLRAILKREDMQERFTEIMEELMEGAFSYEHADAVLNELQEEMKTELVYHMELVVATDKDADYESLEAGVAEHQARYEEEIQKIRDFFRDRPQVMKEQLSMLEDYVEMEPLPGGMCAACESGQ